MDRLELDIELSRGAFRLTVADSLSLDGITAVFGASGSGKTTLLRVIAGLEPAARGRIRFRDTDWLAPGRHLAPEARRLGYVFQDGRLFPHLDVRGNLAFPRRHGHRHGPIDLNAAVAAFGLAPLLARYPSSLSGGERQRVAIARALLANPGLLLMDEPLSSLDRARRRELLPLIRSLPSRYAIPVLYVTHDPDELVQLADDVLLLADGRKVARGSVREIMSRSDFEALTALEDAGTILEASVASVAGGITLARLAGGELRIPGIAAEPGATVRLRVSPRDVILALSPPSGISIRNRLEGTISRLDEHGDGQTVVSIDVGDQPLKARITRDAATELGLRPGLRVFALIKTVALEAFAGN